MYELLKRLVPRRLLISNEWWLRRLVFWFYRGGEHECNICRSRLSHFMKTRSDLMCPRCGSLMRNRRLFSVLESGYLRPGVNVLDFSPSRPLYRKLKSMTAIHYTSSDFASEFIADQHYDLTKLDVADAAVDLVICFHVLEHIEDDRAAIREMYRILRPEGASVIQTPFKEGDIYEDAAIMSPELRRKHFGQEDHVRTYSVEGLVGRLREAGFAVNVMAFDEEPGNYYGFSPSEAVLVARK